MESGQVQICSVGQQTEDPGKWMVQFQFESKRSGDLEESMVQMKSRGSLLENSLLLGGRLFFVF